MKALKNRVIAVTGGAGGIARGIAEAVLDAGGRVGLIDLDQGKATQAAAALNAGDRIAGFAADVTDPAGLETAFAEMVKRMGRLDGLVNNAGIVRLGPADETSPAGLDLELAINVKGVLLASQAAARHFSGKVRSSTSRRTPARSATATWRATTRRRRR